MISLSLYDDFQGWHIQRNVQVDNLDQAIRHISQWEIRKTDHGSYATKNPVEQGTEGLVGALSTFTSAESTTKAGTVWSVPGP